MADWARHDSHASTDPHTWARRLKKLRTFMRWLQQFEPRTEVPDDAIFGRLPERQAPHIYSEQEIVDLLIHSRRKHRNDLKLREDYYLRTIAKARTETEREQRRKILDEPVEEGKEREHGLEVIEVMTGLKVLRIIQTGEVDGHYSAVLQDGRTANFGQFKLFKSYETWWRLAFEMAKNAPVERAGRKDWDKAFAKIQPVIELENPVDVDDLETLRGHLRSHFETSVDWAPLSPEQRSRLLQAGTAFREEGLIYFRMAGLVEYLVAKRVPKNQKELASQLRQIGFRPSTRTVRIGEKTVSRYYWQGGAIE
jgi:hypothetical protein